MPIYAYKCSACGHAQDVLRKLSDPALTVCPACGQSTYSKQVTAAGFQLKGSGWYVTDFRNNSSGSAKASGAATGVAAPSTTAAPAGGDTSSSDAGGKTESSASSGAGNSSAGGASAATSGSGSSAGGSAAGSSGGTSTSSGSGS